MVCMDLTCLPNGESIHLSVIDAAIRGAKERLNAGETFVVTVDREYAWDTSSRWHNGDPIPLDAKIFQTAEAAAKFAKKWLGHPWWCKPNGNYEIVEVVPVYKQVLTHWSPVNE